MDYNLLKSLYGSSAFDPSEIDKLGANITEDADENEDELLAELYALENDGNTPSSHPLPIPTTKAECQVVLNAEQREDKLFTEIAEREQPIVAQQTTDILPPIPPRNFDASVKPPQISVLQQEQLTPDVSMTTTDKKKEQNLNTETKDENLMDNPSVDDKDVLANRAFEILTRRRAAFMESAMAAKAENDRRAAAEFLATIKQFNEALEAVKNGVVLTEADIAEIPPSPPPYKKPIKSLNLVEELEARANEYRSLIEKFKAADQASRARMNERMLSQYVDTLKRLRNGQAVDVNSLPIPPGFEALSPEMVAQADASLSSTKFIAPVISASDSPTVDIQSFSSSSQNTGTTAAAEKAKLMQIQKQKRQQEILRQKMGGEIGGKKTAAPTIASSSNAKSVAASVSLTHNDQLKLVLMRQLYLKRAALSAKTRGDVAVAMDLLNKAKSLDQMVEAGQCGLPINIKDIPIPPLLIDLRDAAHSVTSNNAAVVDRFSTLRRKILQQATMADEGRRQFQAIGDASAALCYEVLLEKTMDDLQAFDAATDAPKFHVLEKELPVLDRNPDVPDDALDLCVERIEHLKLPHGWKPSDCALFVTYNFPLPHEDHQTGRTAVVKGTNEPEFTDTFRLRINRSMNQNKLKRIFERMPLKLEIYQKGGFLRSDKLWGHADVSLAELQNSSAINRSVIILADRRKKTDGSIRVKLKLSKPIFGSGKGTTKITRKWVELL